MLIKMRREVTLPRFTLKAGEKLIYKGYLNRQREDVSNTYITYGGGRIQRKDFEVLDCAHEKVELLLHGPAYTSFGIEMVLHVCAICHGEVR